MGRWHSAHPNRSSVSIEKREMACSFSPDALAIYTAPKPPIDLPNNIGYPQRDKPLYDKRTSDHCPFINKSTSGFLYLRN
jgi:hypothetical protein